MNKYKAKKTVVDGITFDSKKEANRYLELKMLEKAGAIQDLQRQVKYVLIPSQRINGKVVERECSYKADFVYKENGETIVEDTKGFRTPEYKIKRKMMLLFYGVQIREF
jgi:hypothetical protein